MAPATDFSISNQDGRSAVTVVRLDVESLVGMVEVQRMEAQLCALFDQGVSKLVLDMSRLKFAGSAMLGLLMALAQKARASGGQLVLAGTTHIEPLLKVTRSRSMFAIADNAQAAIELLEPKKK